MPVYWYKSDFRFGKDKGGSDHVNIIILAGFGFRFYLRQMVFFLQKCVFFLAKEKIVEYRKTKDTPRKNE